MKKTSLFKGFKNYSKFKRGMVQVNFVITIVNVTLSAFTAMFLVFAGALPVWGIILFLVVTEAVVLALIWKLGDWDWKPGKPGTLYRADIKVDPYSQAYIEYFIAVGNKLGVDVSIWDEWRAERHE